MTAIAPQHGSRRWLVPVLAPTLFAIVGCTSAASPAPVASPSATPASAAPIASVAPSVAPSLAASVAPSPSLAPPASSAPSVAPSLPDQIGAAPAGPWSSVAWYETGQPFPLTAAKGSDSFLLDVYGWSGGYVAFAGDAGKIENPSPATLRFSSSTDGVHWAAPKAIKLDGRDQVEIAALAETPNGLLAAGEYPPATCGGPTSYAGLWRSTDGTSWTKVQQPPAMAAAAIESIDGGSAGFIATGSRDEKPVVWLSADGASWAPASLPKLGKGTLILDNGFGVPGGFVLSGAILVPGGCGGGSETKPAVWWSADGTTWTQESLPKALTGAGVSLWVRKMAGGLVAIEKGVTDTDVADWVTTDGKTWSSIADPGDRAFNLATDGRHTIEADEDTDPGSWTVDAFANDLVATQLIPTGAVPPDLPDHPGFLFVPGPTGIVAVATDGSSVRLGIPG